MTNQRIMITQEPLDIFHTAQRPQKRQKTGVPMDVVAVLSDIGSSNYDRADYSSAEECFFQALCHIDDKYLFSQKSATNNIKTSKIEYDEGMRVYKNLMKTQDSFELHEVAATLFHNIAQTYVEREQYTEAITWFQKSLDGFCASCAVEKTQYIIMNLHSMGYCLFRLGNDKEAGEFYEHALSLASKHNMGPIHVAASMNCVGIIRFNQQPPSTDLVMGMFSKSLSLFRSCATVDELSIATVLNNIGRVCYLRQEFKQALQLYKECMQLREGCAATKPVDVAATAYNLGQTCYQLGQLEESLTHYQKFVAIASAVAGPSSKDVALALKGIGEIYKDRRDSKLALQCFQKALDIYKACSNGVPSTDVAGTLNKMGNLCYENKDFPAALKHYREGLRIEQDILSPQDPNHSHIIVTTTNIAHTYKQLREHEKALSKYGKVYAMQLEKFGQDSFALAETLSSMGLMQYHMGSYEESFDSYQEALRIRRQHLGADEHPEIASTLNSIGLVLFKQDLFSLAKDCFQESLRIRSKILGKDHRDVAVLWYNMATIHFESGEDELAIQMYKETLRVERSALGDDHADVILTLQNLGQVHQQIGHTEKAVEYFQEALEILRRHKEPMQRSVARTLNLLGNVYLQLGRTSDMMKCYVEASRVSAEPLAIAGYSFYGLSKTNPPCAPVA